MIEHSLQQQVSSLKRQTIDQTIESADGQTHKKSVPGDLGRKSIFYDADWNPNGKAPYNYKNVPYNPKTFKSLSARAVSYTHLDVYKRQI